MRRHYLNLVKYFCVGGIAALVDLSLFAVFTLWMSFNYLVVGGIGFLVATAVNYLLCIRYVYQSGRRFSVRGEVIGVYIISAIGLTLHEIILYVSREDFGLHLLVCKILAIALVFFWNFSLRNFYLFAQPKTNDC